MPDEKPVPETLDTIAEKLTALSRSIDGQFAQVDGRFAQIDKRFAEVDRRFEGVDKRFDEVSEAFVEQREYTEFVFGELRREVLAETKELKGGIGRLERKLDRVLDALPGTLSPRRRRRP